MTAPARKRPAARERSIATWECTVCRKVGRCETKEQALAAHRLASPNCFPLVCTVAFQSVIHVELSQ